MKPSQLRKSIFDVRDSSDEASERRYQRLVADTGAHIELEHQALIEAGWTEARYNAHINREIEQMTDRSKRDHMLSIGVQI